MLIVSSASSSFTKSIGQSGRSSMHLYANANVSGNGSRDSIALSVRQLI